MKVTIEKIDDAYSICISSKNASSTFENISKEDLVVFKEQIESAITEETKIHRMIWNPKMRRLVPEK